MLNRNWQVLLLEAVIERLFSLFGKRKRAIGKFYQKRRFEPNFQTKGEKSAKESIKTGCQVTQIHL